MKIVAVRHGETNENVAGIVQGQAFGTLSPQGELQILALAKKLQNRQFDIIYSSDLPRCVKTADAIMRFQARTEMQYDERLRERKLVPYEGMPFRELGWGHDEVHDLDLRPPGGESWRDVHGRLLGFVDEIKEQSFESVLLVTHGGPMRILDAILTKEPLSETIQSYYDNCAIREWDV